MSSISNLTTTDAPLWETSENRGPLVSVITWFLVVTAFLSVLARVSTRLSAIRQIRPDDVAMVIAMFLAIGQSISTSLQASNGLGEHLDSVSPGKLILFQKVRKCILVSTRLDAADILQNTYASGFLYIGALSAVKISICFHLNSLTPVRLHRTMILCVGAFTCLWMLSCFFVIAFQCNLPHPWHFIDGHCIDITGFWTYANIVNILTDLGLVILPLLILSNLQVTRKRKIIIISCFSARVFVIGATIVQIYLLQTKASNSQDLTFDLWTVVLVTSIVQALTLIAACIPYLKPFMGALETGMIRADGGGLSRSGGFGYGIRSNDQYQKYGASSKITSKTGRSQNGEVRMDSLGFSGHKKLADGMGSRQTASVSAKAPSPDSDNDSQSSQSKIIRKTIGWSVTEEQEQDGQNLPNTRQEYPARTEYPRAV